MSREITDDLTYAASLDEVAAMLGDPAFRREVCEAQHVLSHEVTIEPVGAGPKRVRVAQQQSTSSLPSFATKIVGERIQIVKEESWTSAAQATLLFAIPGKPGDITGETTLHQIDAATADTGDTGDTTGGQARTVQTVRLSVTVSIPFIGAKVEGLVADMLLKALHTEHRVGQDYLSR